MLVVGITGGIGAGKGLAADFFRSRGAAIVDADEVARDLMQPGSRLLGEVADAFGQGVLRSDGSLDRGRLSQAVFGDAQAVARLNALTHPPIRAETERRIEELRRHGAARVVCLVAPLLVEAGCKELVDRLLVVVAEEDERVRRVVARDGISEGDVRRRMAAQLSQDVVSREADWVIDTTPGREEARRQLEGVWRELSG
jgi:dephospho-CoA kinase